MSIALGFRQATAGGTPISITPQQGSVSVVGLAATLSAGLILSASVIAMSAVGLLPSSNIGSSYIVSPTSGTIVNSGNLPSAVLGFNNTTSESTVSSTGLLSNVALGYEQVPTLVNISTIGLSPALTIGSTVVPSISTVTTTSLSPSYSVGNNLTTSLVSISTIGNTPNLSIGEGVSLIPATLAVTVNGLIPDTYLGNERTDNLGNQRVVDDGNFRVTSNATQIVLTPQRIESTATGISASVEVGYEATTSLSSISTTSLTPAFTLGYEGTASELGVQVSGGVAQLQTGTVLQPSISTTSVIGNTPLFLTGAQFRDIIQFDVNVYQSEKTISNVYQSDKKVANVYQSIKFNKEL